MSDAGALSLKSLARDILEQSLLDFLLAPATRLIILLQTQDKTHVSSPTQKTGLWHYLSTIYKQEGISGFWRGNLVETLKNSVFRVLSTLALKAYEPIFLPKSLEGTNANTSVRGFFLVIAVEGTTLLVRHPLKVIRIRLARVPISQDKAENNQRFSGLRRIGACVKQIWNEEGIKGFYKGVTISALQTLSTMGLLMLEKNILSTMSPDINHEKHKRRMLKELILSGGPAGMLVTYVGRSNTIKQWKSDAKKAAFKMFFSGFSMLALYPYNVLQARVIAGEEEIEAGHQGPYYVEVAKKIWEKEGIKGFYRGVGLSVFNTMASVVLRPVVRGVSRRVVNTIAGEKVEEVTEPVEKGGKRKRRRDKVKKYAGEKTKKLKEKKRQVAEQLKKAKEERELHKKESSGNK